MVKFINRLTGTEMWVADDRLDEYLAAGHKLAAVTGKPTEEKEDGIRNDKRRSGTARKNVKR